MHSPNPSLDVSTVAANGSLWGSAQYRHWFTADTASAIGATLKGFAISLVAYSLCHSLVLSGWLTTATMIASQLTTLFGGTVVDRHDRKRLVILNAASGAVLWCIVTVLLGFGALTFPVFAVLTTATSAINGLLGGATNALLRSIVEPASYPKAQSLNQARDSVITLGGSPLGGVLYAFAPWLPFAVASFMYALSGVSATQLRVAEHATSRPGTGTRRAPFLRDFADGWVWAARRPKLIAITIIAASLNFGINGIISVTTLHLIGIGAGSIRIGLLDTAGGISLLVGALIATRIVNRLAVGTGVLVISILEPLVLAPLLFDHSYPTIILCMLLIGLPVATVNSLLSGFSFAKTPSDMQGRLLSMSSIVSSTPMAFCSAIAGTLLDTVGFAPAIALFIAILAANIVIIVRPTAPSSFPASILPKPVSG